MSDFPSLTLWRNSEFKEKANAFCGFDYTENCVSCALDHYKTGYEAPNGSYVVVDMMNQFSRETRITIYPSFEVYSKLASEWAEKRAILLGYR